MSLLTSLSAGTTGLASASAELSVVSDNLANTNTVGFKAGRAAFEDVLAQSVVGGAGDVGLGSRLSGVQKIITQGALANTGLSTDLALEGAGYFVLRGSALGRFGQYYSRAGQFTMDRNGYLVNLDGLRVQGYGADPTGAMTSAFGDLQVGTGSSQPRATATITLRTNLAADATVPAAWDAATPATTSNFSTSVTIYDSLGSSHEVQIYFRKSGAGQWEWHGMSDGGGISGGAAGIPVEVASGTLSFDSQGRLTAETQTSSFDPLGANAQPLRFDFGSTYPAGSGVDGATQFTNPSATGFVNQDGWSAGDLSSIMIERDGRVTGLFTNGQTRTIAQVAVANFSAPDQLERMGSTLLAQTQRSGEPAVGAAGEGGRGTIASGALEQSNVDIAEQFVRMIAAQRAFEANSKTITTADQLLSELIAMKR
jgi:flagellar hook protein FlgE